MSAVCFGVNGKRFENGTFRKRWRHSNSGISPNKFSSNKIQTDLWLRSDCCVFKFLSRSVALNLAPVMQLVYILAYNPSNKTRQATECSLAKTGDHLRLLPVYPLVSTRAVIG